MTVIPMCMGIRASGTERWDLMVRCDRCGKMESVPQCELWKKCDLTAFRRYLEKEESKHSWFAMPEMTPDHVLDRFNYALFDFINDMKPSRTLSKALNDIGWASDYFYRRTTCGECQEAERKRWEEHYAIRRLLSEEEFVPICWPWPEDDVPEPMPYQIGAETTESYLGRREKCKALREQGLDPERTPRYRLVHGVRASLRQLPLSDDWAESVEIARRHPPSNDRMTWYIADLKEMKRISWAKLCAMEAAAEEEQ